MSAVQKRSEAFQDFRRPFQARQIGTHYAYTNHRVIVEGHRSAWVEALQERFEEITSLKDGWDGYTGHPVSFRCATFAANMLERLCRDDVPPPSLVPGADGSLQVEWHRNQYDVEIDIWAPQQALAVRINHRTGHEEEIELRSDFSTVADWVSDLAIEEYHEG